MKSNRPSSRSKDKPNGGIIGLGLDADDGQKRITRGKDFLLAGGSEETHAQMQETVIKVSEKLERRGKRIRDASTEELTDLFHETGS